MQLLTFLGLIQALAPLASAQKSCGCGSPLPPYFTPNQTVELPFPTQNRTYRIHIPSNYNPNTAYPVYFSFHGASRNASEQESLSQFSSPSFSPSGGIAIYPQGKNGLWLSNPHANTSYPNDLDFTDALLTSLENSLCVNRSRIYAAGKSNGGGFTNALACNGTVGRRFAAFASVSGAYYSTACAPAARAGGTPFLEFHGLQDGVAPYYGGASHSRAFPKVPTLDIVRGWALRNGCGVNAPPASNDTAPFLRPWVKVASWNCPGKNPGIVQHYREDHIGHCWPSTAENDDFDHFNHTCKPLDKAQGLYYVFNATDSIKQFFGRWTRPDAVACPKSNGLEL